MAAFLTADININEYLGDASALLCEVHEHLLLSDWLSGESDVMDSCSTFLQCMSDFHLAMIAYSHQNSDGFCDTFKLSIRNPLRKIIQSQFTLSDSITRDTYKELSRKICSTVLADILENIKSSSSFAVPDKVTDLPALSSNLVPILCATSAECDYVCQLVLDMHEEARKGENKYAENLRESYICLLSVLSKDGKNKASATSALTRLNEDQLNATPT
uniref:Uncharacterized protein n=1 Tax=Ciona savignyi TaxID=51511 RepID=H2ZBP4_CIOSA